MVDPVMSDNLRTLTKKRIPDRIVRNSHRGNKSLAQRFARNLLKRRKELLLTQAELAERLGVATETLSRFERARHMPSLKMLERMAGTLRMPIAELIGDAGLSVEVDLDHSRLSAALDGLDGRDRELIAATVEHLSQQLRRRRSKH